jgi:G3E family GTPase
MPLTILSTVDPVLRDATAMAISLDVPAAVVLSYAMGSQSIRRTISDVTGPVEVEEVFLNHVCLNCALRQDVIPTLQRLAELDRWKMVALALPVGAEPMAVTEAVADIAADVRVASVVAIADYASLENDVLGEDLLAERGHGLAADDQRAVGEVLAHQLEYADVVITPDTPSEDDHGTGLLDHLRSPGSIHWRGLHELDATRLFGHHHDPRRSARRMDPRHVAPALPARLAQGPAWTIDLFSTHPFHPRRLMQSIEELGSGRIRARGRFWLPTRPNSLCLWDGAGGQLAIGDGGSWGDATPSTRLVITGTGSERRRLRRAFERTLMTRSELDSGSAQWIGADDGFGPWLGDQSSAA